MGRTRRGTSPGAWKSGGRGTKFPQPNHCTELTPATHELVRQNYAAMIENIDTRVREILDTVKRRGELDNTLIVFASDHGEMLGDHNYWGKTQPYHGSVGVPLVVWGQDARQGRCVRSAGNHAGRDGDVPRLRGGGASGGDGQPVPARVR